MDETSLPKCGLYDVRLAASATGATGVWLWSPDGTRVWWANPVGCATFGAQSPSALAARRFEPGDSARVEVVRLAATLPHSGAARLERLRGFSGHGPLWRPLVCSCSRLRLDHASGVLVMATEAAGPALSLAERVRRLGLDADAAIAAVTPDGAILFATAAATRRLAGATTVDVIKANALCATAAAAGAAAGDTGVGPATVRRIGSGASTVLLVSFEHAAPANEPDAVIAAADAAKAAAGAGANMARPATPVPVAKNVVPFPGPGALADAKPGTESRSPALSPGEHRAFRELARQLTARLQDGEPVRDPGSKGAQGTAAQGTAASRPAFMFDDAQPADGSNDRALLHRLPIGILVYRLDELLFANRAFLAMAGYADLRALTAAGGLDALFVESGIGALADTGEGGRRLAIATRSGNQLPVEGRLFAISWSGEPAFAVLLAKTEANERIQAAEAALRHAEGEARELRTILDGVTDAVVVVDRDGRILSSDRGGETLFGRSRRELEGAGFASLVAPAARNAFAEALKRAQRDSAGAAVTFSAQPRDGAELPVSATIRRIGAGGGRFGIAIRDLAAAGGATAAPADPTAAADKSAALTKLCHDARTPLNSILGFCDMMLEERFGPIGNDRYREYVDNIRMAGTHLMTLLADAVDLASIEAGTFRLSPTAVSLNEVVSECVLQMQPQANEARVIVRTSLAPAAHRVVADIGAVRQIVVNLLGHAINSSRPGGQVIVSTGMTPGGDVVLRLRDNGDGLSEKAIAAALQPAGPQETTPPWSSTGQTLPLTKALAEANQARLKITSKPHDGSLFEVSFAAKAEIADWISSVR